MHQFDPIIKEGDTVIISGGATMKTNVVKKGQMVRLGNTGNINTGSLIGHRFGDVFEYDQKGKRFVPTTLHPDLDRTAITKEHEEESDNRNLVDTNVAQALTEADIRKKKAEEGVAGLVDALTESSATFQSKTEFSKEKYVRRKKTKYAVLFKVDRVTTDNIAEVHCPSKIELLSTTIDSKHLRLRIDSVAQLLSHGNVHSQQRCLLHDTTNGVLAAAMLERMSEEGKIYNALDQKAHPAMHVAKQMRLPKIKERWSCVPYSTYFVTDAPVPEKEEGEETGDGKKPWQKKDGADGAEGTEPKEPRISQWMKAKDARELLLKEPVDSLVVAEGDPKDVVLNLIQFVAYGGAIAVYSPYLEPLCQLFSELREEVVCMRLFDTWLREYQVLPGRTHPTVNMNAAGGYILSGIRVQPSSDGTNLLDETVGQEELPNKRSRK